MIKTLKKSEELAGQIVGIVHHNSKLGLNDTEIITGITMALSFIIDMLIYDKKAKIAVVKSTCKALLRIANERKKIKWKFTQKMIY